MPLDPNRISAGNIPPIRAKVLYALLEEGKTPMQIHTEGTAHYTYAYDILCELREKGLIK